MGKLTDIKIKETLLYFIPIENRIPLKFGLETTTHVTCGRVKMTVEGKYGKVATGWGETPLNVQWTWVSSLSYEERNRSLKDFCLRIAKELQNFPETGHPIEISNSFQTKVLPNLLNAYNREREGSEPMPWLAALVCFSMFDIALHDAYGVSVDLNIYQTYNKTFMNKDLTAFIKPANDASFSFNGKFPEDFIVKTPKKKIIAWHLVGGNDPLTPEELKGNEPNDGYPVLLTDWIKRDRLKCLKIKLRGNDPIWDYQRIVKVGQISLNNGINWLSIDFNCTVKETHYVNDILYKLLQDQPRIFGMVLYIEQPFPYNLEQYQIDVHSISALKPLFLDESAHDWKYVKLGRKLGWTGVALKTCKTQTGALLSLCWAKAHGMLLMVQDLTNPMLAMIPHALLGAYSGTIMGFETNACQFYPNASIPEAKVHPGLYRRRNGMVDLSTIKGAGFGYQVERIKRILPAPYN